MSSSCGPYHFDHLDIFFKKKGQGDVVDEAGTAAGAATTGVAIASAIRDFIPTKK